MKTPDPFSMEISRHVWATRYRAAGEAGIRDSWQRVAQAIAQAEGDARAPWAERFFALLDGFRFLPGGRILAGAGTGHRVTLFNCFVMGAIEDALESIFEALKEGALTLQQGGGVGYVLPPAPGRHAGPGDRQHRFWPGVVHAYLGRHVRDDAVDRRAARRGAAR